LAPVRGCLPKPLILSVPIVLGRGAGNKIVVLLQRKCPDRTGIDRWLAEAGKLGDAALASRLGISPRQARRVLTRQVTEGRLAEFAQRLPLPATP
jgi:hypothetical protein